MSDVAEVRAPVENVNDETVAIVRWLVENGSFVKAEMPVLLAETTKATFDVCAPASGYLWQVAEAGTDVPIGSVLCCVGTDLDAAKARAASVSGAAPATGALEVVLQELRPESEPDSESKPELEPEPRLPGDAVTSTDHQLSTRFSVRASELVRELGLDPAVFAGRGLVRERDIRAHGNSSAALARPPVPGGHGDSTVSPRIPISPATGVAIRREPISRGKRYEGRQLRAASSNTLQSAVTVAVPTRGFLSSVGQQDGAVGLPAAVLIWETARLLRTYPMFNAFYADDHVHFYEAVHIGYAFDLGNGLKVPVIRDADTKHLAAVVEEKNRLLVDYLNDTLSVESLGGGTFTVTDLSAEGVVHFHPIINAGQSAILGVCAESQRSHDGHAMFNLVLAFDHQLADGRTAAAFLRDLRDRVVAHEATLLGRPNHSDAESRCSVCLRPAGELEDNRHFLVRTVGRRQDDEQTVCTICLQDWYS